MRYLVFGFLVGLATCATPEMQQMRLACEQGNLQACMAYDQMKMNRAMMMQQGLQQSGAALQQEARPPRAPLTCIRQGVFVSCY